MQPASCKVPQLHTTLDVHIRHLQSSCRVSKLLQVLILHSGSSRFLMTNKQTSPGQANVDHDARLAAGHCCCVKSAFNGLSQCGRCPAACSSSANMWHISNIWPACLEVPDLVCKVSPTCVQGSTPGVSVLLPSHSMLYVPKRLCGSTLLG